MDKSLKLWEEKRNTDGKKLKIGTDKNFMKNVSVTVYLQKNVSVNVRNILYNAYLFLL